MPSLNSRITIRLVPSIENKSIAVRFLVIIATSNDFYADSSPDRYRHHRKIDATSGVCASLLWDMDSAFQLV